jgi:hypothetical protein
MVGRRASLTRHPTPKTCAKRRRRKIRTGRGRSISRDLSRPPGALGNVPLSGRCRGRRTWRSRASTRPLAVSVTPHACDRRQWQHAPIGDGLARPPAERCSARARKLGSVIASRCRGWRAVSLVDELVSYPACGQVRAFSLVPRWGLAGRSPRGLGRGRWRELGCGRSVV